MIWYDSDFDEEIGFPVAEWMLNRKGKPMLRPSDPVAKAVHGVMSRLTQVEIVQGLNIKTYVLDDMGKLRYVISVHFRYTDLSTEQRRASAGPGKNVGIGTYFEMSETACICLPLDLLYYYVTNANRDIAQGGRIFITTAWLSRCTSVDDIAGVLAHEVAHSCSTCYRTPYNKAVRHRNRQMVRLHRGSG